MTEIDLPQMLAVPQGLENVNGETCITCSDEGRPLQIVALSDDGFTALASSNSGEETVDITLVKPVEVGDKVLVHAGMAITKVTEA